MRCRPTQTDKLSNYELGWKSRWFDHKPTLNGAVFYQNWDKFQFSFLGLNSLTVINNGPSADIYGVEVSFAAQMSQEFSLRGGFAYTDAESKKPSAAPTPPGPSSTPTARTRTP